MKNLMSVIGYGVVMGSIGYGTYMMMDKMCKKTKCCKPKMNSNMTNY